MNGWRICLRQCVWMVKMNQSNTGMTRLRRWAFTKCIVIWIIINRNDAFDIRIYANNNTIWKRVSPLSMSLSIFLPHTLTSSESDQRGTEIIVSWTDAMRTTSTLCESNPLPIIILLEFCCCSWLPPMDIVFAKIFSSLNHHQRHNDAPSLRQSNAHTSTHTQHTVAQHRGDQRQNVAWNFSSNMPFS